MLVNGKIQNEKQFINQVSNNGISPQNIGVTQNEISKSQLWNMFLKTFYKKYGYHFIENEETIMNIKILFYYFLKDEEFFKCENLRGDLTKPSFKKGVLIIGGYGLGNSLAP
jgi:DNA replication protein DnaC